MLNKAALQGFLQEKLPEAMDILKTMVDINSFTANPEGVNRLGQYTAEVFSKLGFTAECVPAANPEFGNHLALSRKGLSGRNIAFVSHLDTVFPPEEEIRNNFHWQVEGDRVFGPGTQDIKGGTVMMWLTLLALSRFARDMFEETGWTLLLNAAEERFSPDFGELCKSRFDPGTLAALVFESEGKRDSDHLMVLARKGRIAWRVKVSGRAAHAGGKHSHGANAIEQLGLIVPRIQALTDYTRHMTFSVGTIQGGTVLNRVPHEAVAEGEFRAFDSENCARGKEALLGMAGVGEVKSIADGCPCSITVEFLTETRPWPRNRDTDNLYEFWKAAGSEMGVPTGWEERGGLSDGNLIWDAVPTLDGLGPWGDNDHCSEMSADGTKLPEYVDATRFAPKAMVNTAAILKLLEAERPPKH
jgi:glutamate carboxypeptidase